MTMNISTGDASIPNAVKFDFTRIFADELKFELGRATYKLFWLKRLKQFLEEVYSIQDQEIFIIFTYSLQRRNLI